MKPIVRDSAFADLDKIYSWIAKDNPVAATFVTQQIFDSIDLLSLFPHIGRSGKADKTFEWPVPRLPYILVYTLDEDYDELVIVAVFHTARNR